MCSRGFECAWSKWNSVYCDNFFCQSCLNLWLLVLVRSTRTRFPERCNTWHISIWNIWNVNHNCFNSHRITTQIIPNEPKENWFIFAIKFEVAIKMDRNKFITDDKGFTNVYVSGSDHFILSIVNIFSFSSLQFSQVGGCTMNSGIPSKPDDQTNAYGVYWCPKNPK